LYESVSQALPKNSMHLMPTPLSQQLLLPLSTKQQRVELVEFAIEHNMNMITGNTLLNNNL